MSMETTQYGLMHTKVCEKNTNNNKQKTEKEKEETQGNEKLTRSI